MPTFTKSDIKDNKKKAILCYIFAPLLLKNIKANDSKFLKFHYKQGKDLFIFEIIYILIFIFCNIFLKVNKICIHSKLGIEFVCGKRLPIIVIILLLINLIYILYNIYMGINNVINNQSKKIHFIEIKNNLFK